MAKSFTISVTYSRTFETDELPKQAVDMGGIAVLHTIQTPFDFLPEEERIKWSEDECVIVENNDDENENS